MITLTRKHAWLATAAYAGLLMVVSLLPSQTGPLDGWDSSIEPSVQNLLHVPAYMVLTVLVLLAGRPTNARALLLLAGGCVFFGLALEGLQYLVPGRSASLSDGVLNVLGVLGGLAAGRLAEIKVRHVLRHREAE